MISKLKAGIFHSSTRIALVFLSIIGLTMSFAQPVMASNTVITAVYPSFTSSNVGAFRFNGTAAQSGSAIVLTNAVKWQNGSAWWQRKVSLANNRSFSSFFSFKISNPGGPPPIGADGIVFAIQTQSNGAGSQGGGLGYKGITPSVGVEFDTWNNSEYSDINANHVGIDLGGSVVSVASVSADSVGSLENGNTYYAWVDYNGLAYDLEVRLNTTNTRPATALLTYSGNLATSIGSDVYVGFTASTGGEWEKHEIDSFYFNNDYISAGITSPYTDYVAGPTTVTVAASTLSTTSSTISATLKDVLGNSNTMSGQTITFTTTLGSLSAPTATTDVNGVAQVVLTNSTSGTATVRATGVGGAYGETTVEHNVITGVYPSFDSTNIRPFVFNGSAVRSGSAIILTPAQGDKSGSVWWQNKVTLANHRSFSAYFSFTMSQIPSTGADGIVFAVQTQTNGPSTVGGGMGYQGITPSVGIEFDTYYNSEYSDINGNHVGIDLNGSMVSLTQVDAGITLKNDGVTHYAWVDYDGSSLTVRLSDNTTRPVNPLLSYSINLESDFGQDAFVGFGAGTGGWYEQQEIDSFYFNNDYITGGITPATVTYEAGPTSVVTAASPASGSSSTISATVTDILGNIMPGQTVRFTTSRGTLDSTTAVTDASGIAQVALTNSTAGTAIVRATGVGGVYGETTVTLKYNTTTSLPSSSANPSVYGQSLTFSVIVTVVSPGSGTPTGIVNFMEGENLLGSSSLSNGQATYTTSALSVATNSITGVYTGDGTYITSLSSILSQVVNKASTTVAVSSSSNPFSY